jgi:FAD-dependent urate hydroxylase
MERALVIGGGIAGPVAAIALQKAGFSATVCEAHPAGADEVGSWLTLQANGIDALAAVDAHHLVAGLGFPTRTMRFVNGRGRVLGTMSNGAPLPDGTGSSMVRRADLYRALRDEATVRGAQVRYRARLVDARPRPGGGVEAVFADGSTEHADVLLGADGIRSTVRRIVDPSAPAARHVPLLNLGEHVPDLPLDLDRPVEEFQMMFGTRMFAGITPTPDGGAVWFANPPHPQEPARGELAAVPDAEWRARLTALLADDTGPVADAVRRAIAATPGPLCAWPTHDLPTVPTWHRGPVAIIGDAAHATAPSAGQGAALALEDAVLIARFLRDAPDAPTAFTAFEQGRRARVEKVVAHGNRSSNAKAAGPIGRVVRDAVLPLVFRQASRNDSASTRWITAHHIDWEASSHPAAGLRTR